MKERSRLRNRMIFDLPAKTQMAIRLRAVKNQSSTTEVITTAMEKAFPDDVREAEKELVEHSPDRRRKG